METPETIERRVKKFKNGDRYEGGWKNGLVEGVSHHFSLLTDVTCAARGARKVSLEGWKYLSGTLERGHQTGQWYLYLAEWRDV